jgi:predicted nucleic acid-binding protein
VKTTVDTSILVAAFASWHEHHAAAVEAASSLNLLVAHCLLETYSVLTRLPAPHRMSSQVVSTWLRVSFGRRAAVALSAAEHRKLLVTCAAQAVTGGAVYDAVIAATCASAGARLLTLDARARLTYAAFGIDHELVAG